MCLGYNNPSCFPHGNIDNKYKFRACLVDIFYSKQKPVKQWIVYFFLFVEIFILNLDNSC